MRAGTVWKWDTGKNPDEPGYADQCSEVVGYDTDDPLTGALASESFGSVVMSLSGAH